MTKVLLFASLLIFTSTCTSYIRTLEKIKNNKHCSECESYLNEVLIPQLNSCVTQLDSFKDCKFDKDEFDKHESCFLGMNKKILEGLIGSSYDYSVKNSHAGFLFSPNYSYLNNRLVDIDHLSVSKFQNHNIACLDCYSVYQKIYDEEKIKKMSFEEFHERYKGCFYGKTSDFLVSKLNLQDKIKEGKYQHSYNKYVLLGRDTHYLNFLFYADHKMEDISPVDSIVNRVIK